MTKINVLMKDLTPLFLTPLFFKCWGKVVTDQIRFFTCDFSRRTPFEKSNWSRGKRSVATPFLGTCCTRWEGVCLLCWLYSLEPSETWLGKASCRLAVFQFSSICRAKCLPCRLGWSFSVWCRAGWMTWLIRFVPHHILRADNRIILNCLSATNINRWSFLADKTGKKLCKRNDILIDASHL